MDTLLAAVERLASIDVRHPGLISHRKVQRLTAEITRVCDQVEKNVAEQEALDEAARVKYVIPGMVRLGLPSDSTAAEPDLATGNGGAASEDDVSYDDEDELDPEFEFDDPEDEYEEGYVPAPAAVLRVNVLNGAQWTQDVQAEFESVVLPNLADRGNYQLDPNSDQPILIAPDESYAVRQGAFPNGTVLLRGELPTTGVVVSITVDGDIDPDRPPLNMGQELTELLEEAAEMGDPIPEVEQVEILMERLDREELSTQDATNLVVPRATHALSTMVGPHDLIEVVDTDDPWRKCARLRPTGDGELDRRALRTSIARFDGTLPFDQLGRVRAYARVS